MKTFKYYFIASLAFLCLTQSTFAYSSSHYCTKPYKPYQINSKTELDTYIRGIEIYQKCISDYVKEQQREIEDRQRAIKSAIDEYNRVVDSL